jgi:predicted ribosome quality control (RQC) complex YloA/Tae2 family protein
MPSKKIVRACSIHYSNVMLVDPSDKWVISVFNLCSSGYRVLKVNQQKSPEDFWKMVVKYEYQNEQVILFQNQTGLSSESLEQQVSLWDILTIFLMIFHNSCW